MSTLSDIKLSLRISSNALDSEIEGDVKTAEMRMRMIGVRVIEEEDELTKTALKLHAKGTFNFQGEGARYAEAFEKLATAMALCSEYNGEGGSCHE